MGVRTLVVAGSLSPQIESHQSLVCWDRASGGENQGISRHLKREGVYAIETVPQAARHGDNLGWRMAEYAGDLALHEEIQPPVLK